MHHAQIEKPERREAVKTARWGIWLTGSAISVMLLLFLSLVGVIAVKGFSSFWLAEVHAFQMRDGTQLLAEIITEDPTRNQLQVYIGNRDVYGLDYRWIDTRDILVRGKPKDVVVLERHHNGKLIGRIGAFKLPSLAGSHDDTPFSRLSQALVTIKGQREKLVQLNKQMAELSKKINRARKQALPQPDLQALEMQFIKVNQTHKKLRETLASNQVIMYGASGVQVVVPLPEIYDAYQPNQLSFGQRMLHFGVNIWQLLSEFPRASNTAGGLFPAIFGTVMLVILMSMMCVPLGVVAAVYLREYAKEGWLVSLVRISVNNLAGVPSIIYGVFGLGFFVYGIGGSIDQLFFSQKLPIPTFGTGGILWASITMALLTLPVVIVATEEGLASVPKSIRDGSLAVGATQFQTLTRVVLPMASPGILTGLILAIARAAGEVAPLMLVGVIKSAPSLPVSTHFPFLHFDQKFMHLGYHLYDQAFLSPSVEASMPMVFATSLLLLLLVLMMSTAAMILRNRMRKRYVSHLF